MPAAIAGVRGYGFDTKIVSPFWRRHVEQHEPHEPPQKLQLPHEDCPYLFRLKPTLETNSNHSIEQRRDLLARPDVIRNARCHRRSARVRVGEALVLSPEVVVHRVQGDCGGVILGLFGEAVR
jgi:hypothetical protein